MNIVSIPDRLPAFFGRVSTLLEGREHLAQSLNKLREASAAIEIGLSPLPGRLEPRRLLRELGVDLQSHLATTEGYLRTVAHERPELLPLVVDMRADHAAIARELSALESVVADEARWGELPVLASRLRKLVRAHQEAEANLVQGLMSAQSSAA